MARIVEADLKGQEQVEFNVTLRDPHFESAEKDGDTARMALVLRGETADGKHIDCYQYFTRQIIVSGRNKGKTAFEVAAEQCHALGMPMPFNPKDIALLEGVECVFVVGVEEYKGKTRTKVLFINTSRKPVLSLDDAASIFAELSGEPASKKAATKSATKAAAPVAAPATAETEDPDALPF